MSEPADQVSRPRPQHTEGLRRLRMARGHLDAVIRMLEQERYCIDVTHQLDAVQGALTAAKRAILGQHLRTCVPAAFDAGRGEEAVSELLDALFDTRAPQARRPEGRRRGEP